jgi:cation diffusion facilitator CzcD-associated flavoprotein CzcO
MLCSSTPSIDGKVALEKIRSNTYDSINMDINNYNFQFNPKTSEWTTNVNAYNEEIKDNIKDNQNKHL